MKTDKNSFNRDMRPEQQNIPSEVVDDDGEAIDLETFRADLYRMIDEVYAENSPIR